METTRTDTFVVKIQWVNEQTLKAVTSVKSKENKGLFISILSEISPRIQSSLLNALAFQLFKAAGGSIHTSCMYVRRLTGYDCTRRYLHTSRNNENENTTMGGQLVVTSVGPDFAVYVVVMDNFT